MAAIQDLLQINMGSMNKNDLLKTAKAIQDALRDINERTTNVKNNAGGLENILLRLQMVENKQTTATSDIEKLKKENSSLKSQDSRFKIQYFFPTWIQRWGVLSY